MNKFCIWTPSGNVRVRCSDFYLYMLYIRIDVCHLCLASIAKFCDDGLEKNVEEMVGTTRERRVATESGEDETGDKTAATAGDE